MTSLMVQPHTSTPEYTRAAARLRRAIIGASVEALNSGDDIEQAKVDAISDLCTAGALDDLFQKPSAAMVAAKTQAFDAAKAGCRAIFKALDELQPPLPEPRRALLRRKLAVAEAATGIDHGACGKNVGRLHEFLSSADGALAAEPRARSLGRSVYRAWANASVAREGPEELKEPGEAGAWDFEPEFEDDLVWASNWGLRRGKRWAYVQSDRWKECTRQERAGAETVPTPQALATPRPEGGVGYAWDDEGAAAPATPAARKRKAVGSPVVVGAAVGEVLSLGEGTRSPSMLDTGRWAPVAKRAVRQHSS